VGNLSVDTWRTIYDTLKKQRGTQDAADTPLGQMFALLDGYEATSRRLMEENAKLRADLEWFRDRMLIKALDLPIPPKKVTHD